MEQDKILFIINEISRIVIIIMYITHSIHHWVNYNLILFYEFATKRNLTWAGLMRKAYQLGRPSFYKHFNSVIIYYQSQTFYNWKQIGCHLLLWNSSWIHNAASKLFEFKAHAVLEITKPSFKTWYKHQSPIYQECWKLEILCLSSKLK